MEEVIVIGINPNVRMDITTYDIMNHLIESWFATMDAWIAGLEEDIHDDTKTFLEDHKDTSCASTEEKLADYAANFVGFSDDPFWITYPAGGTQHWGINCGFLTYSMVALTNCI